MTSLMNKNVGFHDAMFIELQSPITALFLNQSSSFFYRNAQLTSPLFANIFIICRAFAFKCMLCKDQIVWIKVFSSNKTSGKHTFIILTPLNPTFIW